MTNTSKMNPSRKKKFFVGTCTEFDGMSSSSGSSEANAEDALQSRLVSYNLQPTPNSLVIQALILQVCKHMEQDQQKRKEFYSAVCRILNEKKFLGVNFSLDELWPLKETYCNALYRFFRQVHENVFPEGLGSCTSVSIRGAFDYVRTDVHFPNRYQQSFEELEIIAKGGFGVVCKARNKVDDITYAVKKIKFKYTNDLEFEKVLREVRSFAQLKHPNIVTYNNSWLETNIISGSTVKTDSDSESSDGEQQNTNSDDSHRNEDHVSSPGCSFSPGTSGNIERNPTGPSSALTSLLIDSLNSRASIESRLMINSKFEILHKNSVIKKSVGTLETRAEWLNDVSSDSTFCENLAGEPHQQAIQAAEHETENSDAKCDFFCLPADETGDCSQKTSRRRRHSSGATCSATDQDNETDHSKKATSRQRSYDRFNSLDLDPRKCSALVPTTANTKWDISNLDVKAILYIQMELCDKSLREWLDERAEVLTSSCCEPEKLIRNELAMFKQIVQGVEHIHSKFIIHRDLKPKNIFLCYDGSIKIGDFGLAALCTQTDQQEFYHTRCSCTHTQGLGTAPYCAPEQKNHRNYDTKVDIYSLGIILIELIHCYRTRMEFCKTVDTFVEGNVPPEFADVLPPEVINLIQRLISKIPQERPEANEILSSLGRFKIAKSLAISSGHQDCRNKENEAHEISELKTQVQNLKMQLLKNQAENHSLKKQVLEKDEEIKELQLKLLYMSNCDNYV